MKIFRVGDESLKYRRIKPKDQSIFDGDSLQFDCRERGNSWEQPHVVVPNRASRCGDFLEFERVPGCLVFRRSALDVLSDIFWNCGEILKLYNSEHELFLLNVTKCIDCLDKNNSVLHYTGAGILYRIEKYAFRLTEERFPLLFKIPQTKHSLVYKVEYENPHENSFIERYESAGLKGLEFQLLWES